MLWIQIYKMNSDAVIFFFVFRKVPLDLGFTNVH